METIYLSLSSQVALGTFFMKSPVVEAEMMHDTYMFKYMYMHLYTWPRSVYYVSSV